MGTTHEELWNWAERHHGLVRSDELRASQLTMAARRRLVAGGDLVPLSPRVLRRAGAPASEHQLALAAVLDAGSGVVVAGCSAAWLWRVPNFGFVAPVELTRPKSASRTDRPLLGVVKERRALEPHHVTQVDGIPVLTLPMTLFQMAAVLRQERFERAADTIVGRSPGVLDALHALLPELAARGRNGITAMRAYLAERPAGSHVPTGLERRFEKLLEQVGHRPLTRQVDLGGHSWIGRTDYVDRAVRLVVEIQSATYHSSHLDRSLDERRIADLLEAGFAAVLEIEEHVVWNRPHLVAPAVDLARRAAASASVRWIERDGVRFHRTERVEDGHRTERVEDGHRTERVEDGHRTERVEQARRRVGTAGQGRMSA